MASTRVCSACRESKPLDQFWRATSSPDGRFAYCKPCARAKKRAWADRNRGHRLHKQREWIAANVDHKREYERERHYADWYRAGYTARQIVRYAIKRGDLTRGPCERCGAKRAQAHHEDVSKPLEVTWLCRRCHGQRHREINEERRRAS